MRSSGLKRLSDCQKKVFPFPLSWSTAERWLSFYWKAYSGQPGVSTSIFGGNSSPLSIELSSYDSSLKVGQESPYSFSIIWEQQLRSYWSPGHLLARGWKHSPRNKITAVLGNFSPLSWGFVQIWLLWNLSSVQLFLIEFIGFQALLPFWFPRHLDNSFTLCHRRSCLY